MSLKQTIRNSALLRRPLLVAVRTLLSTLLRGPRLLRRATYDTMPLRFMVVGEAEKYVISTADKVIGRALFLEGQFDFDKLQTALELISRHGLPMPSHIIDVGANIGTILIPAIKRGLARSGTAIEPHPENLRLLRANLALNDLCHLVEVHAAAAGDGSAETLWLAESATNSGHHRIGADGTEVKSLALDSLGVDGCSSLLWMDIEGYEGHALRGARSLLSAGIPVVAEFNPGFLERTGGLGFLMDALSGRRIFDLNDGPAETSLPALIAKLGDGVTDILAIEGTP